MRQNKPGVSVTHGGEKRLAENLRDRSGEDKPWMQTFGKLRSLRKDTARLERIIEEEFGRIELEDRQ